MLFLAFCCIILYPVNAQTIQIDTTFTTDGEIFPFTDVEIIYGISINGSILLGSDTSLVRVILKDDQGQEWMVYEAYPLIVSGYDFYINEACDETRFLNDTKPFALCIQIIDAEFYITSLTLNLLQGENLPVLQYQAKRSNDSNKV
jgi:hypothetical protein